jgi:predicted Zn-dependent protease
MARPRNLKLLDWRAGLVRRAAALCLVAAVAAPASTAQSQGRGISLVRDTEIEDILADGAEPILRAAGLEPANVNIYLVNDPELNAFVSGGQNIFLHTGLIMKTETPGELAGVIAHETGHIASGHLARSDEGMRSALATQLITMGLGMVAAVTADPRAGMSLIQSANYFATLQAFTYTRGQEAAADQAAARFLEVSGQSGAGLVSFFDNFRYQEVYSDARRFPYFRSHPLSSDRIDALRLRVEDAAHYRTQESAEALAKHEIMVAKLVGFIEYPQTTYQRYPETDQSFPARYARAIADYKGLEIDKSLTALDGLLADYPNNQYLWELKGQILFETGRIEEAEAPQRRAVELESDAPLLLTALAQTLLARPKAGDIEEAVVLLERSLIIESDNPGAWHSLADAYERTGQPGKARLATAEHNFVMGNMPIARSFGIRARELLVAGTPEFRRANDIINAADVLIRQR